MPLIPKAPARPDRESLAVRLDRGLHAQLRDYAAYVDGTKDYVVAAALERLFKADREFLAWREHRGADRREPTRPSVSSHNGASAPTQPGPPPPGPPSTSDTAANSRAPHVDLAASSKKERA